MCHVGNDWRSPTRPYRQDWDHMVEDAMPPFDVSVTRRRVDVIIPKQVRCDVPGWPDDINPRLVAELDRITA